MKKTKAQPATKKPIQPVTLTVTLTGRKAAAFRRMIRYDELTAQEAANEAIIGTIKAFTEMEEDDRSERRQKAAGITRKPLALCPEFLGRVADGIADKIQASGLQIVGKGGVK